jgi:hypothetical protein
MLALLLEVLAHRRSDHQASQLVVELDSIWPVLLSMLLMPTTMVLLTKANSKALLVVVVLVVLVVSAARHSNHRRSVRVSPIESDKNQVGRTNHSQDSLRSYEKKVFGGKSLHLSLSFPYQLSIMKLLRHQAKQLLL